MVKKILFGSLVLFGLLFLGMPGRALGDAAAQLEQANTYLANEDYGQAEAMYQSVVADYPGTTEAYQAQKKLVTLYIDTGNDTQAQEAVDKLLTEFSGHRHIGRAVKQIANHYRRLRKYERANQLYQYFLAHWPDAPDAIWAQAGLAISHLRLGDEANARTALNNLLSYFLGHPFLGRAVCEVAHHYRWSQKYEKALELYQDVLDELPTSKYALWAQMGLVLTNIARGNDAEVQAALDKLIADFSGYRDLPEALRDIAIEYEMADNKEKAQNIYPLIQHYTSLFAAQAELRARRKDILLLVEQGNHADAETAIGALIADFNDHSDLPYTIFRIGEAYYNQAFRYENEGLAIGAEYCFTKAIAVWERMVTELPESSTTAFAYDLSGHCYRRLRKYEKAIECYKEAANRPDYGYAWNALFLLGRSYGDLVKSGLISSSEAEPNIKAAYEQLVEKYPTCQAASIARRWLRSHNKE